MKTLVITSGADVRVQLAEFPDHRANVFAKQTLRAVERFFALPGVQDDYEKWLIEYKKRKENNAESISSARKVV